MRTRLCILFLLALVTHPVTAAAPKRVLIVHSFGRASPPFTTHSTAFETELTKTLGERVDLDEVGLDVARYASLDMEEALVELVRKRQTKWQPDLVVPVGSPAGVFVARYRDRLFPKTTPIIYTGMDKRRLPSDALEHNAVFVGESFDFPAMIEEILQVAPATTNIAVVIGDSQLEHYWANAIQQEWAPFTNRVGFTWLNGLTFDQMSERVATLPPRSFIFLVLLMRDASGVTHDADEALKRIHAVANAPVNGIFQHQLGMGIVGGRLYQAELEGIESARVALRVLRGEPTSNFPPKLIGPLPPRYDWRELRRWKIREDRLPTGSTILFREPTFWERYRWRIIGVIAIVVLQAVLSALLLLNLMKRRRVEERLRESESRFRIVADSAPVLIWMSGLDKGCIFFNKPWLDFTGRTAEQEMGNGWTEGIHPDDLAACLKTYQESFDARKEFAMQYRLRRHDGEYRWLSDHGVPRYDAHGNFAGYIGSCMDITDRLRAEERFRQVFEASANAMIMVNREGRITLVNVQTETLFGYAREELIGQLIEVLIPERLRQHHPAYRDAFLAQPEARPMGARRSLFGRRKDGSEFEVEISLNPIRTAEGLFVVASVVDITERRKTEAETQELRRELTHISRVALMGELTASIAHELNQPLAAILSNAQAGLRFMASGKADPDELRDILKDIVADDQRAGQVIRHLRSLLKKDEAERRPLVLNNLVHDVLSVVRSDAVVRNVTVVLDLAPELPLVIGDRIQLQQVLLNLVVNAFDALAEASDRPHRLLVRTRPLGDGQVQVDVTDNGPGIVPDRLGSVFEPFFTTKATGMGMGLSVSRSIVHAHDGRLWVENNPEGGATFHMVLPAMGDKKIQ